MLRSVTFILENRNSEAAGSRDARHFNNDNGPRALVCRKLGGEAGELRRVRLDDSPAPVKTHNTGRPFKSAEHQDDSPILFQVRDRLHSTADHVQIRNRPGSENPEGVETFGREIEIAFWIEGRSRHEEDMLLLDGLRQMFIDLWMSPTHRRSWIHSFGFSPPDRLGQPTPALRSQDSSARMHPPSPRSRRQSGCTSLPLLW